LAEFHNRILIDTGSYSTPASWFLLLRWSVNSPILYKKPAEARAPAHTGAACTEIPLLKSFLNGPH
jgi:hypothetical protein